MTSIDVQCPYCNAKPGDRCRTVAGWMPGELCNTHRIRNWYQARIANIPSFPVGTPVTLIRPITNLPKNSPGTVIEYDIPGWVYVTFGTVSHSRVLLSVDDIEKTET